MSKEAMKLALEALETAWTYDEDNADGYYFEAITALREALAKPDFWEGYVPKPVGAVGSSIKSEAPLGCNGPAQQALNKKAENARELGLDYEPVQDSGVVTAGGFDPRTQRTWVGLTDEEIEQSCVPLGAAMLSFTEVARAIEAKLKEKNNG
jgi:hypothetical protein